MNAYFHSYLYQKLFSRIKILYSSKNDQNKKEDLYLTMLNVTHSILQYKQNKTCFTQYNVLIKEKNAEK